MKITIYDSCPGPGFVQWCLKVSWLLGCFYQKLIGRVDAYHGTSSWEEAIAWARSQGPVESIQFWGHGSPGYMYLAGVPSQVKFFLPLKDQVAPDTVIWFRTCSTFRGVQGHEFSRALSNGLGCTVAGHTRIIGLLQGGLHTRRPQTLPSWPVTEGELVSRLPAAVRWGPNTVTCFATRIPEGW